MNKYLTNLFALTFFVFALAQDNEESVEEVVVVGTNQIPINFMMLAFL